MTRRWTWSTCGSFAKRRPGQLSGGQQQRVALARALVLQPSVLLLDEPLGALDAKLRRSLKVELKALQEQVGITFLYVTHDQEEALTMSDRLAVMRDGKIVQIGGPHEVYEEPADTYVADFLGVSNLMEVEVVSRGPGPSARSRWASPCWTWSTAADAPDRAHAVIRPERVRVEEFGSRGPNRVPAMVERLVYLGSSTQVILRLAPGTELQALLQNDGDPARWPSSPRAPRCTRTWPRTRCGCWRAATWPTRATAAGRSVRPARVCCGRVRGGRAAADGALKAS